MKQITWLHFWKAHRSVADHVQTLESEVPVEDGVISVHVPTCINMFIDNDHEH